MKSNSIIVAVLSFLLVTSFVRAQNPDQAVNALNQVAPEDDSVIETNVDLEQIEFDGKDPIDREQVLKKFDEPVKAEDGLEIKEDQIIMTNRSLKKIIEENEKLRKQSRQIDAQLKQLRGQNNIEVNKVNTISVERDAYKNQNETMSGMTQQYAQDIENLKQQLKEKDAQLAAQPAGTSSAPAAGADPIALGTIQVTKEDRDKTQNILVMLEEVKAKGQKLRADEAKVHYNMGNMYFKRKEYNRAKNEFESALRLRPKDPLSHFNLAFVSGEYLNDLKTAIDHYKEYLEIDPAADDAPLVREKIIDAELILRAQIPSDLENDVNKETNRIDKK